VKGHSKRARNALSVILVCLGLSGCGTDIRHLLEQDAEVTWRAHRMQLLIGNGEPEITRALDQAEDGKLAACRDINKRAWEATEDPRQSFFEQLLTDLSLLFAFLVPVGSVERCADAQRDYRQAFEESLESLHERGVLTRDQLSGR